MNAFCSCSAYNLSFIVFFRVIAINIYVSGNLSFIICFVFLISVNFYKPEEFKSFAQFLF